MLKSKIFLTLIINNLYLMLSVSLITAALINADDFVIFPNKPYVEYALRLCLPSSPQRWLGGKVSSMLNLKQIRLQA